MGRRHQALDRKLLKRASRQGRPEGGDAARLQQGSGGLDQHETPKLDARSAVQVGRTQHDVKKPGGHSNDRQYNPRQLQLVEEKFYGRR